MNDLGWSRREQPANTQAQNPLLGTLSRYNPFGGESHVQLPTTEGEAPGAPLPARNRREEEEGWFARKSETPICLQIRCSSMCSEQREPSTTPLRVVAWGFSCVHSNTACEKTCYELRSTSALRPSHAMRDIIA